MQTATLAIDPKTGALFVGVGSAGNIGVEPEVKATIQRFDADGTNQTTFASGLRNPDCAGVCAGKRRSLRGRAGARRTRRQTACPIS